MSIPAYTNLTDLASERLGGKALVCSDDFFAEKENLLKPGRGIFIPDKYTDRGKWMDGWMKLLLLPQNSDQVQKMHLICRNAGWLAGDRAGFDQIIKSTSCQTNERTGF